MANTVAAVDAHGNGPAPRRVDDHSRLVLAELGPVVAELLGVGGADREHPFLFRRAGDLEEVLLYGGTDF
jgi:hypothetical protein